MLCEKQAKLKRNARIRQRLQVKITLITKCGPLTPPPPPWGMLASAELKSEHTWLGPGAFAY